MMGKIIIIVIVVLIILIIAAFILQKTSEKDKVYVGPVPEGYDEEHFRKTGETIPLENKGEIKG